MHIPYLFYVVCLLVIAYFLESKFRSKTFHKGNIAYYFYFVVSTFFLLLALSGFILFNAQPEKTGERSERIEIAAMRGGSSVDGNISLFSGHIGSEAVYYFMKKMPDGSMHLERLYANKCYIFEDDIKVGYLVRHDISLKVGELGFIGKFFLFDLTPYTEIWRMGVRYDFHVPRGSVVQGINVDLKDFK